MQKVLIGGSFAPPLSDELLIKYRTLAYKVGGPVGDAMNTLIKCCAKWWELPEPVNSPTAPHPSGLIDMVQLAPDHAATLDEHIPWSHRSLPPDDNGHPIKGELDIIGDLFESINPKTNKELRDAAFHLLWHVHELDIGREPLTIDKLKRG